jgi:hypothetical protein
MVADFPQPARGEAETTGHPGQAVFEGRHVGPPYKGQTASAAVDLSC